MTLSDLAQGESWMDPEERQTAAELVQSLQQSFTDRQIPETSFLLLRVQDYLLHHALCRRLERSLIPDPATAPPATVLPSLAEHIGKTRDRLRKSLKDLEDTAAKLAPPPPPPPPARPFNLPDFYKPILEAAGVDLINDPDFFADEDNFYDVPPYHRPTGTESNPDPSVISAQAETQSAPKEPSPDCTHSVTPAQAGAQSHLTQPSSQESSSENSPHSSQPSPSSPVTPAPVRSAPPTAFVPDRADPVPYNYTPPPPYLNRNRRNR